MTRTKEKVQDAETVDKTLVPQGTFATMPTTVAECIKLSEMIAASDLAPKNFKEKPGNCYIAIQMGAEVGLSPMQAIQNICVINGRPTIYGDMGKALLLSKGCRIDERDIKDIRSSGEAVCTITRLDGKRKATRTFSMDDAHTAKLTKKEGPWQTDPYRMLAWRAFWFCARDVAADLLHGLAGVEEVRDYVDTEEVAPLPEPTRLSDKALDKAPQNGQPAAQDARTAPNIAKTPEDQEPPPEPAKKKPQAHFVSMKSKREGRCSLCEDEIMIGDLIYWDPKASQASHQDHYLPQA